MHAYKEKLYFLLVLRAELADSAASLPDLRLVDGLELLLEDLLVVVAGVHVEGAASLVAVLDLVVELLKDGLEGLLELGGPVEGTTLGGGGALGKHPVAAVGADERVEGLGGLLDGLVEGLRGGVALGAEHVVLGLEGTSDHAHEHTTLTDKVGVGLLLEGGVVQVATAGGNAEGLDALLGLAGDVLVDGDGAVDAAALEEEVADGGAGALGGAEHDVDVLGGDDASVVLEDDGETVGDVEGLAGGEVGLDLVPGELLASVGEEVHDDGTLVEGLIDLEEVLALDPAVVKSLLPRATGLADTDDHGHAVVAEVEGLATALGTVSEHAEGVVLEHLLVAALGVVRALDDVLLGAAKVEGLEAAHLHGLHGRGSHGGDGSAGGGGADTNVHGAALGHAGEAEGTHGKTRGHLADLGDLSVCDVKLRICCEFKPPLRLLHEFPPSRGRNPSATTPTVYAMHAQHQAYLYYLYLLSLSLSFNGLGVHSSRYYGCSSFLSFLSSHFVRGI